MTAHIATLHFRNRTTPGKSTTRHFHLWLTTTLWLVGVFALSAQEARTPQSATPRYHYTRYTELDGLSFGRATGIAQAPDGRIWIATWNGLNVFDGYTFKSYKDTSNDSTAMQRNRIDNIIIGRSGNVWCIGDRSLFLFDHRQGSFLNVTALLARRISSPVSATRMHKIDDSHISILDEDRRAFMLDEHALTTGQDDWFRPCDPATVKNDKGMAQSSFGDTDIINSADSGLQKAIREAGIKQPLTFRNPYGQRIILTDDFTAYYYDSTGHRLTPLPLPIAPELRLENVFQDNQGNLWLYGDKSEIGKLTFFDALFDTDTYGNLSDHIRSTMLDEHGRLWMSGKEGYIRLYDSSTKRLIGYLNSAGRIQTEKVTFEPGNAAYCMYADTLNHCIWIGIKQKGLYRLTTRTESHRGRTEEAKRPVMAYDVCRFSHDDHRPYSISNNDVYSIVTDARGRVWIGTFYGGLNYMEDPLSATPRFIHRHNKLCAKLQDSPAQIRCLLPVGDVMLVGSVGGLYSFDLDFTAPERIKMFRNGRNSRTEGHIGDNDIMGLGRDLYGGLYAATATGGLNQIVLPHAAGTTPIQEKMLLCDSLRFQVFTTSSGAASDVTLGMSTDSMGMLWVVSSHALMRFDPTDRTFENFSQDYFGHETSFSENAPLLLPDGDLLVSTTTGAVQISPQEASDHHYTVPLLITEVQSNGHTIPATDTITLQPDERNIHFSFVAVDCHNNAPIHYAYRLEGVDSEWRYTSHLQSVGYVHLQAGTYRFRLRSTNRYGVWLDHETVCDIVCRPTFWETTWAVWLWILLGLLLTAALVGIAIHIYRLRTGLQMEQKISRMKQQFFTDVSHNLRTPLTLIESPLSEVLDHETLSEPYRSYLVTARSNADRMLALLDKMLAYFVEQRPLTADAPSRIDYASTPVGGATPLTPMADGGDDARPLLLIVEDNAELMHFLTTIFEPDYRLITAGNGQEGLAAARHAMPDLILTDLTMPVMDGLEMIEHLRADGETSHIPIVALTARVSIEDQMRGTKLGVRLYITKPFNATLLRIQMAAIRQEQTERQVWAMKQLGTTADTTENKAAKAADESADSTPQAPTSDETPTPYISLYDRQLLQRLRDTVDRHISDGNYNVDDMASDLALSRSSLSRKCKALTGQSPAALLQDLRLQKAMQLIREGANKSSDVAAQVGFSDTRYFSRCFKKTYGMPPSEVWNDRKSKSQ